MIKRPCKIRTEANDVLPTEFDTKKPSTTQKWYIEVNIIITIDGSVKRISLPYLNDRITEFLSFQSLPRLFSPTIFANAIFAPITHQSYAPGLRAVMHPRICPIDTQIADKKTAHPSYRPGSRAVLYHTTPDNASHECKKSPAPQSPVQATFHIARPSKDVFCGNIIFFSFDLTNKRLTPSP